ncbi:MAG: P-loop NTPase [Gallionella sp.]
MRSDLRVDQAEGLRRLLVRNHTQVLTLVAGKNGVGRTSTAFNLAAALSHLGKKVLVLDENHAPNNLLGHLGVYARHDLLDVIREKCMPDEALFNSNGFSIMSTARAMNSLAQLGQPDQQRLENALTEVSTGVDVMLVDAAMHVLVKAPIPGRDCQNSGVRSPVFRRSEGFKRQAGTSSGFACGGSLLVVMDGTASGITDSYTLIKRLVLNNACLQFEIVVNKVADEKTAQTVFENMAKVAWRNLATRLEYLGCIPRDDRLMRATRHGRPVIDAYPAAASAKSYRDIAQSLLHLPVPDIETDGGMHTVIQKLMRNISQPVQLHGKQVIQVASC